VRRAPGRNPKLHGKKPALEDRARARSSRRLHDPVADSRDRQRPQFAGARLRDENPPGRQRPVPPSRNSAPASPSSRDTPLLLSVRQADTVNAAAAAVGGAHLPPLSSTPPAVDLVEQRMEPSARTALGRPVSACCKALTLSPDSRQGGPSRNTGAHQSAAPSSRVNEAAALPSPQVCVLRLDQYYGRPRPPPGRAPFPGSTPVINGVFRASPQHAPPGRVSPVPAAPSERSAPSYAESPSRLPSGSSPLPWPSP